MTLPSWHPNDHQFDPDKVRYFDQTDPEASGICNAPSFAHRMPRCSSTQSGDDDIDAQMCRAAADFLAAKGVGVKALPDDDDDPGVALRMGPCPLRHSLVPGDVIVVHSGSGFSLMPDARRWSRGETEFARTEARKCGAIFADHPFLATFSGYHETVDSDDECVTNYALRVADAKEEGETIREVMFMPFDVVKNVRVGLQQRCATTIQRAWRLRKMTRACVVIQRFWKERFYEWSDTRKGPGPSHRESSFWTGAALLLPS